MNKVFFFRRHLSCSSYHKLHSLLLIGIFLLTLFVGPVIGQTEVQELAVVINALTHPDLEITASLSLIDLMEPSERRAVDNEILHFSTEPLNRRRAVGLSIRGHLAYIPTFNLPITGAASSGDSIFIINLEDREIVGEIPIEAGSTPQQIALIDENKLYVTCAACA